MSTTQRSLITEKVLRSLYQSADLRFNMEGKTIDAIVDDTLYSYGWETLKKFMPLEPLPMRQLQNVHDNSCSYDPITHQNIETDARALMIAWIEKNVEDSNVTDQKHASTEASPS
jgi:hypothetical protein